MTLAEDSADIHFDHDRNGFAERTGWVSPTDGLLVRDLDGNGKIDHGGEVFGNHTDLPDGSRAANGFEALKALDANGDRFIDHLDAAWSTLKVWMDGNSNGSVDPGELLSMQQAGVLRLGVDYATSTLVDSYGHQHLQAGEFLAADGSEQAMHDVWFRVDPARTRWLHPVALQAGLAGLPDLKGMGGVRDLHQAMALDPSGELRSLLERWIQGSSVQRQALIDPLIFHWTGVSSMSMGGNPSSVEGRLAVMERLLGQQYREGWADPNPVGISVTLLHQAFEAFRLDLENQLILQTDAWPILQQFVGPDGTVLADVPSESLALAAEYLDGHFLQPSAYKQLFRFGDALRSLGDEGLYILARLQDDASTNPSPTRIGLELLSEYRLLQGSAGADQLQGNDGHDLIDGGPGDDVLYGGGGRDWLIAGVGEDYLNGGFGDDVYVIGAGEGQKRIGDWDYVAGNRDLVLFTDVGAEDVQLVERNGAHLCLYYGSGDQLWVENYFQATAFRVEAFQFADGTVWGDGDLRDRAVVGGATAGNDVLGGYQDMANRIDGLEGNDQLSGGGFGDVLVGGGGNDVIHGQDGDDHLDGGSGDDVLYAGGGRDWLIAGAGEDYLNGGFGDDVYVIGAGEEQKTIGDWDYVAGNRDLVLFTDVGVEDVQLVERNGAHLCLYYGSGDQLWVENYFQATAFRVEAFQFADGTVWGDGDLRDRAVVGGATAGNDVLGGYQDMANRIDGLEGNDQLYGGGFGDELVGGSGNDELHGLEGDDHLDGGAGDDALYGGGGRDWLIAGAGEDVLNGGLGDDVYVISGGEDRKTINDGDFGAGSHDVVMFTDLKPSDVKLVERNESQLLLHFSGGGQLSIDLYFHGTNFRVEAFQFSNGTVWGDHQLRDRVVVGGATGGDDWLGGYNDMANRIKGLRGDDALFGGVMNDALRGGNGNDTLHGGDGDDLLHGGSGHDVLYGGLGSDRLVSGRGSDILNGGEGDDNYVIVKSGALKKIIDHDPNPSNHDVVYLKKLPSTDVVSVQRLDNHLEINFVTSDQLLVENYFLGESYRVEEFQFSNGIAWDQADVFGLIPPA